MNSSSKNEKPTIAIFASPKCVEEPKLYKAYFNVAWFVREYDDLLRNYRILTTPETKIAVEKALDDMDLGYNEDGYWDVPHDPNLNGAETGREGFDGQVRLAGEVASGKVERVLMFMDPLDTKEYLPETYAFIRNCALANVGLHINLGATYWAESARRELTTSGWAQQGKNDVRLQELLNPKEQTIYFIAHDGEKEKMSHFVFHYRKVFAERARAGWNLSGTSGTLGHINKYFAVRTTPFWETPSSKAAGAGSTGHGPTGGDVIIAYEICERWPVTEKQIELDPQMHSGRMKHALSKTEVTNERNVRKEGMSHTVLFFIDYYHAQPHEADIHLLLRTCLNPHRGVHLILNERTAIEWGETIREGCFSKN